MKPNITPSHFTIDADGIEIAHVPIRGGHIVQMEKQDFENLAARCGTSWFLNSDGRGRSYVTMDRRSAFADGRTAPTALARIIAEAGFRQRVRYDNGDRLDLRRRNLRTIGGTGKHGGPSADSQAS